MKNSGPGCIAARCGTGILLLFSWRLRPVFGAPVSKRLRDYRRFDVRIGKAASYSFGDVLYYLDILNVTGRANITNRSVPLRNAALPTSGMTGNNLSVAAILPDDEEGIPFFIAFGITFSF